MANDTAFPMYDTEGDPNSIAADIFGQFAPELRDLFQVGIERGFGNALRGQMTIAGVSPGAYGPSAMFNQQNVGSNLGNFLNLQAIGNTMQPAQEAMNDASFNQRALWQRMLHSENMQMSEKMADQRMNLTNIASNYVFGANQPKQLLAGMQEAQLYLGGGYGAAPGVNESLGQFGANFVDMFNTSLLGSPSNRLLLGGQDSGILLAEMARTGGISPGSPGFAGRYRDFDKMAYVSGSLFQGGLADRLDQMNRIVGADYMQTFGGFGAGIMQNLSATGQVTGFTSEQLLSFAGGSMQLSESIGADPYGSLTNAQITAEMLGAFRQGGVGSAFVREPRFRESILRSVTGAQESRLSRDISGAYALIAGADGSNSAAADAFVSSLSEGGGRITGDAILSRLNQLEGFGDVTAASVRNASYTTAGEQARARGVGTRGAMAANISMIESDRRAMLRRRLSAEGLDAESILFELGEGSGGITQDTLSSTLSNMGIGSNRVMGIVGAYNRGLEIQADALGMGNAAEVDAFITTSRLSTQRQNIMDRTRKRVGMEDMFQGRGALSGFRNLQLLFRNGNNSTSIGDLFGLVLGDTNLSNKDIAGLTGLSDVVNAIDNAATDPELSQDQRDKASLAQLGLGAAMNAGLTGKVEGSALSSDALRDIRSMLRKKGSIDTWASFAESLGTKQMRSALAGREIERLRGSTDYSGLPKGERQSAYENDREIAIMSLENSDFMRKGLNYIDDVDTKERFKATLDMRRQAIEGGMGSSVKDVKSEIARMTKEGGFMSDAEFERVKRGIAREDPTLQVENSSGDATGILNSIFKTLNDMLVDGVKLKSPG